MRLVVALILLFCPAFAAEPYAVVVIGGGPAGLACATECTRAGYRTMLLNMPQEGIFAPPLPITNWPGFPSPAWNEAIGTLQKSYGTHGGFYAGTRALSIKREAAGFLITTEGGTFHATAVVVATGRHPPPIPFKTIPAKPGRVLSRLWDESFLTQKDTVVIIGPGSAATESAIRAAVRAKRVFLFRQPLLPLDLSEEASIQRFPKISRLYGCRVTGIIEGKEETTVEYMKRGSKLILKATWVALAQEWVPNSEIVRTLVPCDSSYAIVVRGPEGLTSVPGLFACGEVSTTQPLLGILASAEGVQTAQGVCAYLAEGGVVPVSRQQEEPKAAPPATQEESE